MRRHSSAHRGCLRQQSRAPCGKGAKPRLFADHSTAATPFPKRSRSPRPPDHNHSPRWRQRGRREHTRSRRLNRSRGCFNRVSPRVRSRPASQLCKDSGRVNHLTLMPRNRCETLGRLTMIKPARSAAHVPNPEPPRWATRQLRLPIEAPPVRRGFSRAGSAHPRRVWQWFGTRSLLFSRAVAGTIA